MDWPSLAVAAFLYAALVSIMWGPFNPHSGMPYETGFAYNSSINTWWSGFLWLGDPLRIHTTTFYHLSYLTGKVLGIAGSYVPFQVIYALLWFGRGLLVFLLVSEFLPGCLAVSYAAGALTIMHAADGALLWVGQLNQFGFIFWMLAAFYLLTMAMRSVSRRWAIAWLIAACFFEHMSLWSYESQILLLILFPLLPLLVGRRSPKPLAMLVPWYFVIAAYISLTFMKYAAGGPQIYQTGVLRKGWGFRTLIDDWFYNIVASLEFWKWPREGWIIPAGHPELLSLLAATAFLGGGAAMFLLERRRAKPGPLAARARVLWVCAICGFTLLALSFPAYLLLESARSQWRTQFLSGIGFGVLLAAASALISLLFRRRALRMAVFLIPGAAVTFFGTMSALQKGARHRFIWERHRTAIVEVLHAAPSVIPNTVIVLTDVPKDADPFGHDSWFDLALRLVYPRIHVAGLYFYMGGEPAEGDNLKVDGERWKWDGTGYKPAMIEAPFANTVIVRYDPAGNGGLVKNMPPLVCGAPCDVRLYDPSAVIRGPLAPEAARAYFLNP